MQENHMCGIVEQYINSRDESLHPAIKLQYNTSF